MSAVSNFLVQLNEDYRKLNSSHIILELKTEDSNNNKSTTSYSVYNLDNNFIRRVGNLLSALEKDSIIISIEAKFIYLSLIEERTEKFT